MEAARRRRRQKRFSLSQNHFLRPKLYRFAASAGSVYFKNLTFWQSKNLVGSKPQRLFLLSTVGCYQKMPYKPWHLVQKPQASPRKRVT